MSRHSAGGSRFGFASVDLVALALIGGWVLLAPATGAGGDLRVVLGLVAVFVAPGYALVAALFPEDGSTNADVGSGLLHGEDSLQIDDVTPNGVERLVLAIGLSVCLVPLLGLGLHYSGIGIDRQSVLTGIGAGILLLTVVALVQRWRVPPANRFSVTPRRNVLDAWGTDAGQSTRASTGVTILLVGALLLATTGIGVAVWAPTQEQTGQFTEFYLQTRDPETGEYVTGEYPDDVSAGPGDDLFVGITNHEGEQVEYTVVSELQQLSVSGERRVVASETQLNRVSVTLASDETTRFRHDVSRDASGEYVRLIYLLYRGEPPADPSTANAYRQVHLWIGEEPPA